MRRLMFNVKCVSHAIRKDHVSIIKMNKPLYCKYCKLDDVIDVTHKKCVICNLKHSHFNYPDEKQALYCKDCEKMWYG